MHASEDFSACTDCHVEHQGEDFDLIYWPDGKEGFDHRAVGFEKTGAHVALDCRKCHNAKFIVDAGALKAGNKNLGRTYLGLEAVCTSCHEDVHGKTTETEPRACTDCHGTEKWKPAAGFDHARSAFPLTGKHQQVDCGKCHVPEAGPADQGTSLFFAGLPHAACTDCHTDPHANALGPDCRQCHTTAGWLQIQGDAFDHSKTRYPLMGRHASVTCAGCHDRGRKKPSFAACTDCHGDAHQGASLSPPRFQKCDDCHSVEGFQPVRYSLARHDKTVFPLEGAHRATACNACHLPLEKVGPDLTPAHENCMSCHQDPHLGHTDKYAEEAGCLLCHDKNGWRPVAFDHALTGYRLEGRHQSTACLTCHPRAESGIGFRGLVRHCAGCHEDIHLGQFADRLTPDGQAVDCGGCHVTVDWLAEKFDHDTDSRFALKGGHERVACTACHLSVEPGNDRNLKFKPLPVSCKDCHANEPAREGNK